MSISSFCEYVTESGDRWRVERGPELLKEFQIQAEELTRWHSLMVGQGRIWEVTRRAFAVRSVASLNYDEMQPWEMDRIGRELGLKVAEVEDIRVRARVAWKQMSTAGVAEVEPVDVALTPEQETGLLHEFGFTGITDAEERAYLVRRIQELKPQLESTEDRPMATQLLNDELTLVYSINVSMAKTRQELRDALATKKTKDIAGEQDRLEQLLGMSKRLNESIASGREQLGLGEAQTGGLARKAHIQGTASEYIEGHRAYYAKGDRTLVDGIFTAGEVRVLTKPYGDRPAQYRVELALVAPYLRDGIWDENFKLEGPTRAFLRKIRPAFRAVLEANLDGPMEDLDDDPEEDEVESRGAVMPDQAKAATEAATGNEEPLPTPGRAAPVALGIF